MGSATTQALEVSNRGLASTEGIDLQVASELFAIARVVGGSSHLSGALADPAAPAAARAKVVDDVFGSLSPAAVSLVKTAVEQRWSSAADLVDGIEELAVRSASIAAPSTDLEGELFAFTRTVAANPQLELALGSRLGSSDAKGALVDTLLGGRAGAATALVVSSLVQQPGERRVRQLLSRALRIVSDQRNRTVATVVSASPLSRSQAGRLASLLSAKYGREVSLNTVVDPAVIGGIRVQIADDVIDASVASRLAELRHRLAG